MNEFDGSWDEALAFKEIRGPIWSSEDNSGGPQIMKIEFPTISRDQISRYGGKKLRAMFPHLSVFSQLPKSPYGIILFLGWGGNPFWIPIESLLSP